MDESEVNEKTPEELKELGFIPDREVKPYKNMWYTFVTDSEGNRYHYRFPEKKGGKEFIKKFYEVFEIEPIFVDPKGSADEGKSGSNEGKSERLNNNGRQSSVMSEAEEDELVRLLVDVLETTSGIQPKMIEGIRRRVTMDPDFYKRNPTYLMKVLMGAGLSWLRARDVLDQVYGMLYKDNPEENVWLSMFPPAGAPQEPYAPPYPQYPYRPVKEEDPDEQLDKRMNRMMMNMMIMNMIKSMNPQQNAPAVQQNAIVEYEPVIGEDGKPVVDANGNIVMKQRVVPIAAQPVQSADKEIIGVLRDALKSRDDGGGNREIVDMLKTLFDTVRAMNEKQVEMLKERIDALESSDPIQGIKNMVETLKEMGLVGGPQPENAELAKMRIDLEKWKHEQDLELRKWLEDQRMKLEDKRYAREQMKEFSRTLREGISKVAVPIAEGMGEGYKEGLKMRAKEASKAKEAQPQPQEPPRKDITEMSTEELLKLKSDADMAKAKLAQAEKEIMTEIQRRNIKV